MARSAAVSAGPRATAAASAAARLVGKRGSARLDERLGQRGDAGRAGEDPPRPPAGRATPARAIAREGRETSNRSHTTSPRPASRNAATDDSARSARRLGHRRERRDGLDAECPRARASPHAVARPTRRPVKEPGPAQTATRSQRSSADAGAIEGAARRRAGAPRRRAGLPEGPPRRPRPATGRRPRDAGSRCRGRARSSSSGGRRESARPRAYASTRVSVPDRPARPRCSGSTSR